MKDLEQKGRYRAVWARSETERRAAFRLRHRCFIEAAGLDPRPGHEDRDAFDGAFEHLIVQPVTGDTPVACCRVGLFDATTVAKSSYSAAVYDLSPFSVRQGRMAEIGRFCIAPEALFDPDILRVAWGALTTYVDRHDVQLLFGCSSFVGTTPADHDAGFRLLGARHVAPPTLAPSVNATEIVPLPTDAPLDLAMARLGLSQLPPLLRTYIRMGGWVSDHAVIDRELNTMHVLTGLEVHAVPAGRARILRRMARTGIEPQGTSG